MEDKVGKVDKADKIAEDKLVEDELNEEVAKKRAAIEKEFQDNDAPPADHPRRVAPNAKELILTELPSRAKRAGSKLKAQLSGKILIEVTDKNGRYLFDWRADEVSCKSFDGTPALNGPEEQDPTKIDCIIKIKEPQLMAIQSGELNPQIALVNEKVRVEGRTGLAMYFFNLVYPPSAVV